MAPASSQQWRELARALLARALGLRLSGVGAALAAFAVPSTLMACAASRLPLISATSPRSDPDCSWRQDRRQHSIRSPIIGGLLWAAAIISAVMPVVDLALTSALRSSRPLAMSIGRVLPGRKTRAFRRRGLARRDHQRRQRVDAGRRH